MELWERNNNNEDIGRRSRVPQYATESFALILNVMQIKTIYPKLYVISYRRGKDVQKTEVVDAKEEDVLVLISKTFKGRFAHPNNDGLIPATKVQVIELDNIRRKTHVCPFHYTKDEKSFERPFVLVGNMSPRQVRLELEKAIRKINQ